MLRSSVSQLVVPLAIGAALSLGCSGGSRLGGNPVDLRGTTAALVTPDTTHTGFGALVYHELTGELRLGCSGTLVAPDLFLTAGHCTAGAQQWLAAGLVADFELTFDQTISETSQLVPIAEFITFPPAAHSGANDPHDLGLVRLATPVTDRPLTALPRAGLLDELKLAPHTPIQAYGYGIDTIDVHGRLRNYLVTNERSGGAVGFNSATKTFVNVSQLAGRGFDNICFGDSGGADMVTVDGVEHLIAVNMSVCNTSCENQATLYRVDTAEALAFLGQYLPKP